MKRRGGGFWLGESGGLTDRGRPRVASPLDVALPRSHGKALRSSSAALGSSSSSSGNSRSSIGCWARAITLGPTNGAFQQGRSRSFFSFRSDLPRLDVRLSSARHQWHGWGQPGTRHRISHWVGSCLTKTRVGLREIWAKARMASPKKSRPPGNPGAGM